VFDGHHHDIHLGGVGFLDGSSQMAEQVGIPDGH